MEGFSAEGNVIRFDCSKITLTIFLRINSNKETEIKEICCRKCCGNDTGVR